MKKPSKSLNRRFAKIKEREFKNSDEFVEFVEIGTKQRRIINEELFPRMDAMAMLTAKMFNGEFDKLDIKRFKDYLYYKGMTDPKYANRGKMMENDIEKLTNQLLLAELYGQDMNEIHEMFYKKGFQITRLRELPKPIL